MKINANSIRVGNIIEHKNKLWIVHKIQHTQPGKGGAYIQMEMKDIKSGTKLNERFRSEENIEKARIEAHDYQFLYMDGDNLALMDLNTYDQIHASKDLVGDALPFLQDGMNVKVESYEGETLMVLLPETVIVEVKETEAVVKGQTAASSNKPAILENDVRVMVPPFINAGEKIVVRTEDSTYLERSKEA